MLTTDYNVTSVLEVGVASGAPSLPEGVTHVWVGAFIGNCRVLRWQREHGWSEVYRIPADGRITLDRG